MTELLELINEELSQNHYNIVVITGPTSMGKSGLAVKLGQMLDGEIVNGDSLQIYKALPILSAAPIKPELTALPHYLYGILPYNEQCSVAKWHAMVTKQITQSLKARKLPIIVGGTGMYLSSLVTPIAEIAVIPDAVKLEVEQLLTGMGVEAFYQMLIKDDPRVGLKIKPGDKQRMLRFWSVKQHTGISLYDWQNSNRLDNSSQILSKNLTKPDIKPLFICLLPHNRQQLYKKAECRFADMLANGAIDEVVKLYKNWDEVCITLKKAIGVGYIVSYLQGQITLQEATEKAQRDTRHYIKRQITWLNNKSNLFESPHSKVMKWEC